MYGHSPAGPAGAQQLDEDHDGAYGPWTCAHAPDAARCQGLCERLVPAAAATGAPFDHGTFDVVIEPLDTPSAAPDPALAAERLVQITRPPRP